ncbi:capping protein (actin filament) muscle Z-line, alpha [Capronia coronata CBS 617.96]|uniref:F-actin-capping protein subunit alpha n=1 Tax=Capronia coronata CBS 617.96 TaxID=1182541 RepID=W9Z9I0_9EURO|nr:capping protein (actin filament) muscle Z-line, alpha [Capronia coronata CBS 617.96]EXJ91174.1 capping protein (actin filament) muscle Z-line, alpha [Capronia coronata CBS 617.96]
MTSAVDIASSFIQGAPPGELQEVVKDIKTLTSDDDPALIAKLNPAFERYNEEQMVTVKLPGSSDYVLISKHNKLSSASSRYYDTQTSTSFEFDHTSSKASAAQSYTHETQHSTLIQSILKSLAAHFADHYPPTTASAYTVCATPDDDNQVAVLLSTTKASPKNFLSGRWRSVFLYDPSTGTLGGEIKIDVHYYEDGNVALTTSKKIDSVSVGSGADGAAIVRKIAAIENQYQEEVNRAFVGMNETSFKQLRRQLPVTRQKVEWEKVKGYSLGSDLKGEAKR